MARKKPTRQPKNVGTTISEFLSAFPNEEACRSHLLKVRISNMPCPRCGKIGPWKQMKDRRVYLHNCAYMRSITAGSSLHRSRLPLQLSFYAMLLSCNSGTGLSSHLLSRHLGLSIRAAFRLGDRIRTQMAMIEDIRMVGGQGKNVYIDELLIRNVRSSSDRKIEPTIVLGLRDDQHLNLLAVERRNAKTILPIIRERVRSGSTIVTDGYAAYKRLSLEGWDHQVVNHSREWKNSQGYDQSKIETVFKQFRRVLRGTHVHVGREYLWKYLAEMTFRFNRRWNGANRFWDLISAFPDANFAEIQSLRTRFDLTTKAEQSVRDRAAIEMMPTYR